MAGTSHADVQDPLSNMMPSFGQAVDAADGRALPRPALVHAPWRRTLKMNWDYRASEAVVDAMVEVHEKLSAATGGTPFVPPTWTIREEPDHAAPAGRLQHGSTAADQGVVDGHPPQVFGYPGLHVMDGATLPRAIGLNPSRTIAALAERIAAKITRA